MTKNLLTKDFKLIKSSNKYVPTYNTYIQLEKPIYRGILPIFHINLGITDLGKGWEFHGEIVNLSEVTDYFLFGKGTIFHISRTKNEWLDGKIQLCFPIKTRLRFLK